MSEKIIYHNEDDVTLNLLSNPNLVVIHYLRHQKDCYNQDKPIKSCSPNKLYLALKEGNKYKLITRNNYDKSNSGYVYLNTSERIKEYGIRRFVFKNELYITLKNNTPKELTNPAAFCCIGGVMVILNSEDYYAPDRLYTVNTSTFNSVAYKEISERTHKVNIFDSATKLKEADCVVTISGLKELETNLANALLEDAIFNKILNNTVPTIVHKTDLNIGMNETILLL